MAIIHVATDAVPLEYVDDDQNIRNGVKTGVNSFLMPNACPESRESTAVMAP
jgi:hypothetical protein